MKKNKDKRLLSALDHIDDRFVESAGEKIKERPMGLPTGGVNKMKMVKQIAWLAACLALLAAVIPLVTMLINNIPEVTGPAGSLEVTSEPETVENVENELPEEYFTTGKIVTAGSAGQGLEYNGYWIYAENVGNAYRIAKYDPASNTASSVCLDSSCSHSIDACAVCSPVDSMLNYMDVSGDWLIYDFSGISGVRLYNIKTGVSGAAFEETETKKLSSYHVIDGSVYMSIYELDAQGDRTREYISNYDLASGESAYMFDEPEGMTMIGVSNKRVFFTAKRTSLFAPAEIWTTDYQGGNLKKEEVLNFDPIILCGTYAYAINDMSEGNVMRVYDLETNSTFTIDMGVEVNSLLFDSDNFGYVTTSNSAEWAEYTKNRNAYIKKLYPDVTDKNEIEKIKARLNIELLYKGEMKIYIGNERGENMELVFEGTNMYFTPYRIVGDYLMGNVTYASETEYKLLDTGGNAALNLKTGEIVNVPECQD